MKHDLTQIQHLTGAKLNQTLIGVNCEPQDPLVGHMLSRFAELKWQVIDLNAFNYRLPTQVKLAGSIVHALPDGNLAQRLLAQGVPTVRLGRLPHPDDARMPAIIPDQTAAGVVAAEHFLERGFVHLGFVAYEQWHSYRSLYEGFSQRATELGSQCHLLMLNEQELKSKTTKVRDYYEVQRQHISDWWQAMPQPLGLLAGNDMAAHRYCQWAIQAGLRVPEDLAILGNGNITLTCEGAVVPLSSIDPNRAKILDTAIDTLGRLMAGETVETCTIAVPPKAVVTRRSTDVLAASNPNVAAALRYMWDHITENLSVEQIVEHVGVSRRTLEVGFQRDLKRGINAELQRRRLEKARDLLLQTDWRVGKVAEFLGYNDLKAFSKAFRTAYGISPKQYRKQS